MTNHDEHFQPEFVEEQLNSPGQATPTVRMIHDLQQIYSTSTHSGERVWTRLAEGVAQQNEASNNTQLLPNTSIHPERFTYMQARSLNVQQGQPVMPQRKKGHILALVASLLIAAIVVGSTLWILITHNPNTGSRSTVPGQAQTTQTGGTISQPILYDLTSNGLYALDASSGKQLWHNTTVNAGNAPVISGKRVYVDNGTTLYAFDAQHGTQLWKFAYGGHPQDENNTNSKLLIGQSGIYLIEGTDVFASAGPQYNQVGGKSGLITPASSTLSALDPATGNLRWQHVLGYRLNDPVISGEVIYGIGSTATNGVLYALKGGNGMVLWQQPLEQSSKLYYGTLAVSGALYFASTSNTAHSQLHLYAFALSDGQERWQSLPMYDNGTYPITVVGGVLYYRVGDHNLYAFNAQNDLSLWTYHASTLISNGILPVAKGQIYFVTQKDLNSPPYYLQALNASSGKQTWSNHLSWSGTAITWLMVSHDLLYVYSNDNSSVPSRMTIVDPIRGTFIKRYALPTSAGISKLALGA